MKFLNRPKRLRWQNNKQNMFEKQQYLEKNFKHSKTVNVKWDVHQTTEVNKCTKSINNTQHTRNQQTKNITKNYCKHWKFIVSNGSIHHLTSFVFRPQSSTIYTQTKSKKQKIPQ